MRSIKWAFTIISTVIACMTIVPALAGTSIRISSSGEYLGQGQILVINDADNTINATVEGDNSVRIVTSFENWNFVFDNVGEGPLLEGVYEEATRYPSESAARPGLDVHGDGRGCNTLTARFAVLEAEYSVGGEVVRFAADLELECGLNSTLFRAAVRINSDLPLILETPTASAGRDRIVFERDKVTLDATTSVGGNGSVADVLWTQIDGPAVNLSSVSSETPSFEAPDVLGTAVILTFQVEVVNVNSLVDTDIMTVEVRDRSQPRSWLSYDSASGDPIGQGITAYLTEDDGVFTGRSTAGGNQVSLEFDGDDRWHVALTAPEGQTFTGSTDYLVTDSGLKPFIAVGHGSRNCGVRDGSFYVYSFTPGAGFGEIGSFSAHFEQTCANSSAPLAGEIRYQVVLPEANAGPSRTELERVAVVLDPGASTDAEGSIVQVRWDQLTGPPLTLVAAADGSATFTHELGDTQLEQSFDFRLLVIDELGQVDIDLVTINIIQDNQAPVAANDIITLQQGFTLEINPLANDTDIDGQIDASRLLIVNEPDEGFLYNNNDGFTYVAPAFFTGTTTATYIVYDNDEAESNSATITLEIQPGPLGYSDEATTDTGNPVTIHILANDQAVGALLDPATVTIIQQPNGGTIEVNANGSVTYTSFGSYSGQDFFSYDVADGDGLRIPTTNVVVSVKVPASQQPPQPVTPPTPSTPSTPVSTPAPTQAAPQTQQPEVCSDVGAWTGTKTCGGGSLSPLSFLVLGFAVVRIRRRAKSGVAA